MTDALQKEDLDVRNPSKMEYAITDDTTVIKGRNFILSYGDLNTTEQKIMLIAISQYKRNIEYNKANPLEFEIPLHVIRDFLEYKGNSLADQLFKCSARLTSHKIQMRNKENGEFAIVVPVPFCKLKKGYLHIRFEEAMKESLAIAADSYNTEYLISNIKKMQSMYSIRVYEILKMYLNDTSLTRTADGSVKVSIPLNEFKLLIGASTKKLIDETKPHTPENTRVNVKYVSFGSFKKAVLDVVEMEINTYTGIRFSIEPVKKGKLITDLEFTIQESTVIDQDRHVVSEEKDPTDQLFDLIDRCSEILPGLKISQLKEIVIKSNYNFERIFFAKKYLDKIGYTNLYQEILQEFES